MNHVAIILVNFNGKRDTLACLDSLSHLSHPDITITTYVVDNASVDGSSEEIEKKYPTCHIIHSRQNLGFSGGNNLGIVSARIIGVDAVWLLNNDTIVDKYALMALWKTSKEKNVGIVGSKIYFAKGSEYHKDRYKEKDLGNVIWYAGGLVDWNNIYASHIGVDEVDRGQFSKMCDTEFTSGCSMFITRVALERVGLLDEKYFMYLEDVDYCMRARKKGFRTVFEPSSRIWHVNASTSGGPGSPLHNYYLTRNRILFGLRYAPIRSKFALIRQSILQLFTAPPLQKKAVSDGLSGHFGKTDSI